MSTIFGLIADVIEGLAGLVSGWLTAIFTSGNDLIMICVLIPFAFLGIKVIKRLMSV